MNSRRIESESKSVDRFVGGSNILRHTHTHTHTHRLLYRRAKIDCENEDDAFADGCTTILFDGDRISNGTFESHPNLPDEIGVRGWRHHDCRPNHWFRAAANE